MDDKKNTSEFIDELIESASKMETVDTPPFFKDKVLNKLSQIDQKKKKIDFFGWFAPKYQIATLLLFAVLNLAVLYTYLSSNEKQDLQTFAETYGFSDTNSEFILN
ncbi:hypothetical protein LV716_02970 [Flagellimonas sp. HMM57]|uniref:hypothetical protein n=1 Tax=unclassified Flagellimonas TaxID=2644544 RepID=UPI0013D58AB8|nr:MULTISPECIES: hypothetical protein [unclassified Flagellimonas]UII76769.1 hypothetical protein LV716_02970 [Flagellimonas sp. HMM57]